MERGTSAVRWLANKAASLDLSASSTGASYGIAHAVEERTVSRPASLATSTQQQQEEVDERDRERSGKIARNLSIQRKNMLYLLQLIVRQLIECALDADHQTADRQISSESQGLANLFAVLERILLHNFRPKLTPPQFLSPSTGIRDLWAVVELLANNSIINGKTDDVTAEFRETLSSVRDFPGISTTIGRVRAFLRMTCMKKKLPHMFACLADHRNVLRTDFYDAGGMLIEEEGSVLQGILVSLNFIDYNFCIKEAVGDLDSSVDVSIDLLPYLKVRPASLASPPAVEEGQLVNGDANSVTAWSLQEIMDQKNYLEEHNLALKSQVSKLEQKLRESLAAAAEKPPPVSDSELHASHVNVQHENHATEPLPPKPVTVYADDVVVKQLHDEINVQKIFFAEIESTLKKRDAELQDSRETLTSLRQQLDDLKHVNTEMFHKLQSAESALQHKQDIIRSLETRMREMAESLKKHGGRLKVLESERQTAEEQARKLAQQLAHKDLNKTVLESDLKLEQDQRTALEALLDEHKNRLRQLQAELGHIRGMKDSYSDLQKEHEHLRQQFDEQESALTDLGSHLRNEKLRNDEYKEWAVTFDPASMQWERDDEVTHCRLCAKIFNKIRRKHHCRSCGGIFCASCSENMVNLPSAKKPVRCCDACHVKFLAHNTGANTLQHQVTSALANSNGGRNSPSSSSTASLSIVAGASAAPSTSSTQASSARK